MISNEEKINKIDKKLNKINSKRYSPWFYETYVEYKIRKLERKRASLSTQKQDNQQDRTQ